jgi:protein ImuA
MVSEAARSKNASLPPNAALRRGIRQMEDWERPALALGLPDLEAHLPQGGLVLGALHEVRAADFRALLAAQGFLLALTACLLHAREGPVLWPALLQDERDFGALYAPGLKQIGIAPSRLLRARCRSLHDLLWTLEEGARHGGLGAVLGARPPTMTLTQGRRLQLAASASGVPVLLLRKTEDEGPSPALTRWRVAPLPASRDGFGFLDRPRWQVSLERVRGGHPGSFVLEWDHVAHRFHPSAALAYRKIDARPARARSA